DLEKTGQEGEQGGKDQHRHRPRMGRHRVVHKRREAAWPHAALIAAGNSRRHPRNPRPGRTILKSPRPGKGRKATLGRKIPALNPYLCGKFAAGPWCTRTGQVLYDGSRRSSIRLSAGHSSEPCGRFLPDASGDGITVSWALDLSITACGGITIWLLQAIAMSWVWQARSSR